MLTIETTLIKKLKITSPDIGLISVYLENIEKGQGKIIIEHFGKSWSCFWGSLGDTTITEFVSNQNNPYLIDRLAPDIVEIENDYEAFGIEMRKKCIEMRKDQWIDGHTARIIFNVDDWSELVTTNPYEPVIKPNNCDLTDSEWEQLDLGGFDVPTRESHQYTQLSRIITIVKEALKNNIAA